MLNAQECELGVSHNVLCFSHVFLFVAVSCGGLGRTEF